MWKIGMFKDNTLKQFLIKLSPSGHLITLCASQPSDGGTDISWIGKYTNVK